MDAREKRIQELETAMQAADFWTDKNKAQALLKEYQELKRPEGEGYDEGDAIITIFSGAGGDDAEDFSAKLLEMYRKFAARLKEELLTKCRLDVIVRLPGGEFTPYAAPKVNLLFFTKGEPTKEVWYYALPLPAGVGKNGFTKTMPLRDEHMAEVRKWWKDKKENEHAWKVSIDEIKAKNWSLDFKNPNGPTAAAHKSPKELLKEINEKENNIADILAEIQTIVQ